MAEKATKKAKEEVVGLDLVSVSTTEKSNQGEDMTVIHPGTGEPTEAILVVCGEDSVQHDTAMGILSKKRLKAQRRSGRSDVIYNDVQEGMMTIAMHCVVGWRGVLENGVELPFNRANLRRVLSEYKFILEQVNAFIGDRANFLPG